jgi:hypothetical protein
MGLLPKEPADLRGWGESWKASLKREKKTYYDGLVGQGLLKRREADVALTKDLEALEKTSDPYVYVRATVYRLNSDPLTTRFGYLRKKVNLSSPVRQSRFALKFLIDHQQAIVRGFERHGYIINENSEFSRIESLPTDEAFDYLREHQRIRELPDERVDEVLEVGRNLWSAYSEGLGRLHPKAVLFVTGMLAEYGETSLFQEYCNEIIKYMQGIAQAMDALSGQLEEIGGRVDAERTLAITACEFWYYHECLLDLEPVDRVSVSNLKKAMKSMGKKLIGGGGEGNGGTSSAGGPSEPSNGVSGPAGGGTMQTSARLVYQPWMRQHMLLGRPNVRLFR